MSNKRKKLQLTIEQPRVAGGGVVGEWGFETPMPCAVENLCKTFDFPETALLIAYC